MKFVSILTWSLFGACAFAADPHYTNPLNQTDSLQRWWVAPGTEAKAVAGTGIRITAPKEAQGKFRGVIRGIPAKPLQGKLIRVSVEAKAENLVPVGNSRTGGKFMFTIRTPKETFYPQKNPECGTYGWKMFSFDFFVPHESDKVDFNLGIEHASGSILFRNLKVEILASEPKVDAYYFDSLTRPDALSNCWIAPGSDVKALPGTGIRITTSREAKGKFRGLVRSIPVKPLLGKRIRISVEAKAENLEAVKDSRTGGKFMLSIQTPKETFYPQENPKTGTYGWKTYSFEYTIPPNSTQAGLALGTEHAAGTILFRNVKVEILDTLLDLSGKMNMGFADPAAGDGKGGWSDQGPDNDARNFNFSKSRYANVPFKVVNPAKNNGKSALVFRSSNFQNGLPEAVVSFGDKALEGRYLYLLHTMTYGTKDRIGTIELIGKNGKKQILEVKGGRDVNDWWMAKPGENAHPAEIWTNASGGIVGVFASVFPLNAELGELRSIRLTPASRTSVWIVLAATLSSNRYEFPKAEIETIRENAVWKPFHIPEQFGILPNSALDRGWEKREPVGAFGRVIVNKEGKFAFEKNPEKPVHFFAAMFPNTFVQQQTPKAGEKLFRDFLYSGPNENQKSKIHDAILTYRHKGYNMLRMHMIEGELAQKNGLDFPADVFDNFFYAIKCMKDNGIYLNLDVAASHLGYYPGITWADWTWRKDHKDAKKHIYFDEDSKENWKAGARKVLLTVNPYTKMRLIDDPVLVCLIGFNEQEFIFSNANPIPEAMPRWKKFLKEKYGTIDRL